MIYLLHAFYFETSACSCDVLKIRYATVQCFIDADLMYGFSRRRKKEFCTAVESLICKKSRFIHLHCKQLTNTSVIDVQRKFLYALNWNVNERQRQRRCAESSYFNIWNRRVHCHRSDTNYVPLKRYYNYAIQVEYYEMQPSAKDQFELHFRCLM